MKRSGEEVLSSIKWSQLRKHFKNAPKYCASVNVLKFHLCRQKVLQFLFQGWSFCFVRHQYVYLKQCTMHKHWDWSHKKKISITGKDIKKETTTSPKSHGWWILPNEGTIDGELHFRHLQPLPSILLMKSPQGTQLWPLTPDAIIRLYLKLLNAKKSGLPMSGAIKRFK